MANDEQAGVTMIRHMATRLGPLRDEVVFLGGAVTKLLLTDTAASEVRFTEDVDVITGVNSRTDYYRLEETLRGLGFVHDRDVICRWNAGGVVVDVMPTDAAILGFSNRWYPGALETAAWVSLEEGLTIRLITAPYFVATKLEAFRNPRREGSGDYLSSRDLSDVMTVVDGRQELATEVQAADAALRLFIREEMARLRDDPDFMEALLAYLLPDKASEQRLPLLAQRVTEISELI